MAFCSRHVGQVYASSYIRVRSQKKKNAIHSPGIIWVMKQMHHFGCVGPYTAYLPKFKPKSGTKTRNQVGHSEHLHAQRRSPSSWRPLQKDLGHDISGGFNRVFGWLWSVFWKTWKHHALHSFANDHYINNCQFGKVLLREGLTSWFLQWPATKTL